MKLYVDFDIDFMNMDIETLEPVVLGGWDWTNKRPKVICVEIHALTMHNVIEHPTAQLLYSKGFHMLSRLCQNAIFVDGDLL